MVIAFGATEQHGHHMPLATDALLGDHLARQLAERLDAFVAPTVRVGCSSHHLAFPGTLSLADDTFHAVVADLVSSLVQAGFGRVVLVPATAATSPRWPQRSRSCRNLSGGKSSRSPT